MSALNRQQDVNAYTVDNPAAEEDWRKRFATQCCKHAARDVELPSESSAIGDITNAPEASFE